MTLEIYGGGGGGGRLGDDTLSYSCDVHNVPHLDYPVQQLL